MDLFGFSICFEVHCYFLVHVSILNVCPSVSWRPRTSSACGPCWTWPTATGPCWAHPGSWYLLRCRYTHTQTRHECLHLVCGYFFGAIHHQQHSLSVQPLLQIVVPHFHLPSNFSCCSTWSGSWGWSQGWVEPLSLAEPRRDPAQWVCPRFFNPFNERFLVSQRLEAMIELAAAIAFI